MPLAGTWNHVRLQDCAASPWRNGGGLTHELVSQPAEEWFWRVSVARIDRNGPFSSYPGVRRQFAVLRGAGVHLVIDGQDHVLTPGSPAVAFDGDQPCRCELIDGPTLDFNLMTRGGQARLQRWRTHDSLPWTAGHIAGVYACAPACVRHDSGELWQLQEDELLWSADLRPGLWELEASQAWVFGVEVPAQWA
jgi:environmental stress-induced protein Ves